MNGMAENKYPTPTHILLPFIPYILFIHVAKESTEK